MMGLKLRTAVCIATLAAGTIVAVADDEADLVRSVEDNLERVEDYLDGIAGDASDGDLGSALDHASRVRDAAERLRALGPQAEPGRTIADRYPDWTRSFTDAAAALRQLKGAQLRMREDGLAERCRQASTRLKVEIQDLVRDDVPEAISSLPERAERAAEEPRRMLAQHEQWKQQAERSRDDARRFLETHGKWSGVRSELHDGAKDTWDLVRVAWDDASRECSELVRGRDNPVVVEALRTLTGTESGRKLLIEEMTSHVVRIAMLLDGIAVQAATGEIDDAIARLRAIEASLAVLERTKGKSADAKRTFETWTKYVSQLAPSLAALRRLKEYQYRTDRAPERCTQSVQERGQALAKGHRNAGREAIEVASTIGAALTEAIAIANAEQGKRDVESLRREVRLDADGDPWQAIESPLARGADAMVAYYGTALETAKARCEDVAKGAEAERFKERLQGLCTRSELQGLDTLVDQHCKGAARTCSEKKAPTLSCAELRERLERNQACLSARLDIRTHCKLSDPGHDERIEGETNAVATCQERIDKQC